MAYKKEYPVLNDSGAGSLEEYTKRQEDRIEEGFNTFSDYIISHGENFEIWRSGKICAWNGWEVVDGENTIVWNLPTPLKNLSFHELNTKYNITYNLTSEFNSQGSLTNNNTSATISATIRNRNTVQIRYSVEPRPLPGRTRFLTVKIEGR